MKQEPDKKISHNGIKNKIQLIKKHIEEKKIITIERNGVGKNTRADGFPLLVTDTLLLMTLIVDFHDEGFLVMRLEDITDAYSNESDTFYEEICINEGLRNKEAENPLSNVTNIASILKQLFNYKKFITVQCEYNGSELAYSIGKISSIEENTIHFKNFDMMGMWEEKCRIIPLNKITLISIDDHYSNIYYKYMGQ